MSALWTAAEAAVATSGKATGDWVATGVSIDTRTLATGDLFVALKDARDGHDFVASALREGAAAALVSRIPDDVPDDAPLLLVDDVLVALEKLAEAARARCDACIIAITGSVGKTSTKDMLAHVLRNQGRVHAAVMSLNNHWGVPLTLARMPKDSDFAVIEIGMNHPGEISPLAQIARPHVVLITTVAEAHMAAFDGIRDVAAAKAEIFDGLEPGGKALLNMDIETSDQLCKAARKAKAEIIGFGENPKADLRLIDWQSKAGFTIVTADIHNASTIFKIGAPGRHLAMNGLAVLGAVEAAGEDIALAALDLASWQPPQGRGERCRIGLDPVKSELRLELIDDAYNANPASMAAALDVLADSQPVDGIGRIRRGRRICFLTDMLELGAKEVTKHRDLVDLPSMDAVDIVHLAGPLMQHLHQALPSEKQGEWHAKAEDLAARIHRLIDAGDVVMVKGSKGSRASLVVDAIKKLGQANTQQE